MLGIAGADRDRLDASEKLTRRAGHEGGGQPRPHVLTTTTSRSRGGAKERCSISRRTRRTMTSASHRIEKSPIVRPGIAEGMDLPPPSLPAK